MVSFEIFVKSIPPSLSELKVLPSFCFAFKIPDDVTASKLYIEVLGLPQKARQLSFYMKSLPSKFGADIPTQPTQGLAIFKIELLNFNGKHSI